MLHHLGGVLLAVAWAVGTLLTAVAAALNWGELGVLFTIGGMIVAATWYLGLRFSRLESRMAAIEVHVADCPVRSPSDTRIRRR